MGKNRLSKELSPYLLQHAENPVDWYPWSEDAFQKAQTENKAIFLSIGYSTCYWCHVMEQDSFEKNDIAEVLNQHFVAIKVDREERPDVDNLYMDAVVAINGQGGWPLSVFLTPDLKPFWGATFFPHDQFIQILNNIKDAYSSNLEEIQKAANELSQILSKEAKLDQANEIDKTTASLAFQTAKERFDPEFGGFSTAPKFPSPLIIDLLITIEKGFPDLDTKVMINKTLDAMACGGIFDQIGGGFHRYAVDQTWTVPHFEKMLYDNAQLTNSYLNAYQACQNKSYLVVAEETLSFLEESMLSPKGGFYSAIDAGAVDREGEYYVWQYSELEQIFNTKELDRLSKYLKFSKTGNFEQAANVFTFSNDLATRSNQDYIKLKKKLKTIRDKRQHPHIDQKIIVAWNALCVSAFIKAYTLTNKQSYLEIALKGLNYILDTAYLDQKLYRIIVDDQTSQAAVLEDYIFLIKALLDANHADSNSKWLELAIKLEQDLSNKFWDNQQGGFFSTAAKEIISKKKDFYDHVMPSPNALGLNIYTRLNALSYNSEYQDKLKTLRKLYNSVIANNPYLSAFALKQILTGEIEENPHFCKDENCNVP